MSDSLSFDTAALTAAGPSSLAPPPPLGPALAPAVPAASATMRPAIMQLAIRERAALYQAYIPLFASGGIFVPTTRECRLGDDLYVLLTLPEDPQRYPVAGKVAWITPARASGNRTQGVGLRFPDDDKSRQLKVKIEQMLGGQPNPGRPTQTI